MLISTRKVYPPVGVCIYCGATADEAGPKGLTDEHIIPLALAGDWILPSASCESCAVETGAFEGSLAGQMFEPPRAHFAWKSRKRKKPNELLFHRKNEGKEPVRIPLDEHPPAVLQPIFRSSPHLLTGYPLIAGYGPADPVPVTMHFTPGPLWKERFAESTKPGGPGFQMTLVIGAFFRTVAKVAHSYAVAELGIDGADYLLRDIILGKKNDYPNYIGSINEGQVTPGPTLHVLGLGWNNDYLVVRVRFYAIIGAPSQFVVAGRKKP